MNERDGSEGCFNIIAAVVGVICFLVTAWFVASQIEKRDNWIRDLQRRVGHLETTERK